MKELSIFNGHDDGWADAARDYQESMLHGELIKFSDGQWLLGREGVLLKQGLRLVATSTAHAWVKWIDNKPVEYRPREPGKPLAERVDLGDTDQDAWEAGLDGKPRDPWQNTRFCYLVDPETASVFTFSTATWAGRDAVKYLGDCIIRMRGARPGCSPVVEFSSAPHQTKFGRKTKPVFTIVAWVGGNPDQPNKQLPPSADLQDELPF
jgi:hypothetical protein